MSNRRAGRALSPARERRRKACPPHLVLAGTARGRVANLELRSRRLCPPYRFLVSGTCARRGPAGRYVLMRTPLGVLRVSTRARPRGGDAIFEQPHSFAGQRIDPFAIFVDEFGGDQRLARWSINDVAAPPPRLTAPGRSAAMACMDIQTS